MKLAYCRWRGVVIFLIWLFVAICTAEFSMLVIQNQAQGIRLKSSNPLSPGTVLNLPITIPEPIISLDGKRPPRLDSISCYNASGFYRVGDSLHLYLQYFAPVIVRGNPRVKLNTGCHSRTCVTPEVQSFYCQASRGYFSMQLDDQVVTNIEANTTKERFEQYLRVFTNVYNVTVYITPGNNESYNKNRLCSSVGNEVTIVFNQVDFPQYNGDVPTLLLNRLNNNPDPRTGTSQGTDTNFLRGIVYNDPVQLSDNTTEITRGVNRSNTLVSYSYGNETKQIAFIYTVALGDNVYSLDVTGIDFSEGNISSRFGTGLVSTAVPPYGRGARYMTSSSASLSSSFTIGIASFIATVVNVTSPNASGIYTAGDRIFIDVTFDLSVVVAEGNLMTLEMATGLFTRLATYAGQLNNDLTIRFVYDVQLLDTASVLDVTGTGAFSLNGAQIYRVAGVINLDAVITLPVPGAQNSLSSRKTIVINTQAPVVSGLQTISPAGNYTGGDSILIAVTFSTKVSAVGNLRIALANTPRDLNVSILSVPYLPQFSYRRSSPGGIVQIVFDVTLNVPVLIGDHIFLSLPRLFIRDPDVKDLRKVTVEIFGLSADNFTGSWNETNKILTLTAEQNINAFTPIQMLLEGRSGLFVDVTGISMSYTERIGLAFSSVESVYSSDFSFNEVAPVGFEKFSITILPKQYDKEVKISLDFAFPEPLHYGDVIELTFPGFAPANSTVFSGIYMPNNTQFSYAWHTNTSILQLTVTGSTDDFHVTHFSLTVPLAIGLQIPETGVDSLTVALTTMTSLNGNVEGALVTDITNICSVPTAETTVVYLTSLPGSATGVVFSFSSGIFGLNAEDYVQFTLSQLSLTASTLSSSLVYGTYRHYFTVSVTGSIVQFTATKSLGSNLSIQLTVDSQVGLTVPSSGVQIANGDSFTFFVVSSSCSLDTARKIVYTKDAQIIHVTNAEVVLREDAVVFDSPVAIDITVGFVYLVSGDTFIVTMAGFAKSISQWSYNNSRISNANLTARYNRRLNQLEFTLLTDFNTTHSGPLYVNISRAAGFLSPSTSIVSDGFLLSATSSQYGALKNYEMTGPCLGFCSASLDFSTYLTYTPLTLTLTFAYSEALSAGSQLFLEVSGIQETTAMTAYIGSTLLTSSFSTNGLLNFTLTSAIAKQTLTTVIFSELEFINTALTQLSAVIKYVDNTLAGTASTVLTVPVVYTPAYFDSGNFTVNVVDELKFVAQFLLPLNAVLYEGSYIYILLHGFTYIGTNVTSDVSASPSVISKTLSYYDSTAQQLVLYVSRDFNYTHELAITGTNFKLPAIGLSANSSLIAYAVGLSADIKLTTSFIAFKEVSEIIQVSSPIIDLTLVSNTSSSLIETISVSFSTATSLLVGYQIKIAFGGKITAPHRLLNHTLPILSSNLNATAKYIDVESAILVTLDGTGSNSFQFFFNVSAASIEVTNGGIKAGSTFELQLLDSKSTFLAVSNGTLPCIGLCSVTMTPSVPNPARASQYTINATFGGILFVPGDTLALSITSFTSTSTVSNNISCVGDGSISVIMSLFWDRNTSVLTLLYPSIRPLQAFATISCIVPLEFGIVAPKIGVRSTDIYSANWTIAGAMNSLSFHGEVLSIGVIGSPISSSINILPQASAVPVNLTISFRFRDDILRNDIIYVYLPNFGVPSRALEVVPDGNISLAVTGFAATTIQRVNPDNSVYLDDMIAYLQVQMLSDILAGDLISFAFSNTVGVSTPKTGVYTKPFPWFAVVSATSPIAGVTFHNITKVGTLVPNSYKLTESTVVNTTMPIYYLLVNFTLLCPFLENDSISISVPNLIATSKNFSVGLNGFNSTSKNGINFAVIASNATDSISVVAVKGYITSGAISFYLILTGYERTHTVVYEGDDRIAYSLSSTICPVSRTPFQVSSASFVASSSASVVPFAGSGKIVYVGFSIQPVVQLLEDDFLLVSFKNLRPNGNLSLVEINSTANLLGTLASVYHSGNISTITMLVQNNVAANKAVIFATMPKLLEAFLTEDFVIVAADVTYQLIRNVTDKATNKTTSTIVFAGTVQTLVTAPYLVSSSIVITTPVAGSISGISINFHFSSTIDQNNTIVLSLPGFILATGYSITWTYVSPDTTQQFKITWSATTSTLTLAPLLAIPALTAIMVEVRSSQGLTLPLNGVPLYGEEVIVELLTLGVSQFQRTITDITNVPFLLSSSISFLSCDNVDAFAYGGDSFALQLLPGYEISKRDISSTVAINGTIYTIANLTDDNVLYIVEEYSGERVFLGDPFLRVSSPPYRYAYYVNGSGTNRLVFEYHVYRGDSSSNLTLYTTPSSIDLNGGGIFRYSEFPKLPSVIVLGTLNNGAGRIVNTGIPSIVRVFTTSPSGSYSEGQLLDIWLQFSYDVVLDNEHVLPVPEIILTLDGSTYGLAKYDQGSGTSYLVFLYEVRSTDVQLAVTSSIFDASSPVYQPLRIITGNVNVELLRRASEPLIQADLSLASATFDFPYSQRLVGETAKVISLQIISQSSLSNQVYTAGDSVSIQVTYSSAVNVTIFGMNISNPYIALNIGNENVAAAYFYKQISPTELIFTYQFTSSDVVADGLYLNCTCSDFLQRTFIVLNHSEIISVNNGFMASLLIANSPATSELLIASDLTVDNSVPVVESLSVNVTNGIFGPGDSMVISTTYSVPVMVIGWTTLLMKGSDLPCRASYYEGNGTSTISYLYFVSYDSGTSRLDCRDADAVDTSKGNVYKMSNVASIVADNTLPDPGSPTSLGRLENIVIDTTPAILQSVQPLLSFSNVLATKQLPFNFPNFTFEKLFDLCSCDVLNDDGSVGEGRLTDFVDFESDLRYTLVNTSQGDGQNHYNRYLLENKYLKSIEFIPTTLQRCFNWWKGFEVTDRLSLAATFDRPVALTDALLELNTGVYRNAAKSGSNRRVHTLQVSVPVLPAQDPFFAFYFEGLVSECIPVATDRVTIAAVLNGIVPLRAFDPVVANPVQDGGQIMSFEITFNSEVDLQLLTGDLLTAFCSPAATDDLVELRVNDNVITFSYDIVAQDSLILLTNQTIAAGMYSVNFTGPVLNRFGSEENSFVLEQLSSNGLSNGSSIVQANSIARITASSLYFGSVQPGTASYFQIEVCASILFAAGDQVRVTFPSFNETNAGLTLPHTANVNATWEAGNNSILFTFLQDSLCIGEQDVIVEYPVTLRYQGIYENDPSFTLSTISSTVGDISHLPFEYVSAVGMARFAITFNDSRPYYSTELQLVFETTLDLQAGSDSLQVTLPGFYAGDIFHADIYIIGPLNGLIEARWSNVSAALFLSPLLVIPAGSYNMTVQSRLFPIRFSKSGISINDPPTILVEDADWSMQATPIQSFPLIIGYSSAKVKVGVNTSYSMRELQFLIDFAHDVDGPAQIYLYAPPINQIDGYFRVADNGSDLYDYATWFEFNSTFVIYSATGFSADQELNIFVQNLTGFTINSRGILRGLNSGLYWSVIGANGLLPQSPIESFTYVPAISNSIVKFTNIQANAFYVGMETMQVSFSVNTYPELTNAFHFKFDGIYLNFSSAIVSDVCYYISSWMNDGYNETQLTIGLSNATYLCYYRRVTTIAFNITKVIQPFTSRPVKQYGNDFISIAWSTRVFNSDYHYVDQSPWIGLYSSFVDFSNPFAGASSLSTFKFLTASSLSTGDVIRVNIPDLTANWTSGSVADQYGRSWTMTLSNGLISFFVPFNIPAGALSFALSDSHLVAPPSTGIAVNTSSSIYTYLEHSGVTLLPQRLSFLTPVGALSFGEVLLKRRIQNNEVALSLLITLETLNPLYSSDTITIEFTNLLFKYSTVLPIESQYQKSCQVFTTSNKMITINLFELQSTSTFAVEISLSELVAIDGSQECNLAAGCVASVSIDSYSNPLQNAVTDVRGVFLADASIELSYVDKYPPVYHYSISNSSANSTVNSTATVAHANNATMLNVSNAVLAFEFNFTLQSTLPTHGYILLNVDKLLNTSNPYLTSHAIESRNKSNDFNEWTAIWTNTSMIKISPRFNVSAGNQSLSFSSDSFMPGENIIFTNGVKVEYSLYDGTYTSDEALVDKVIGFGLASASLNFTNPKVGEITGLVISISSLTTFEIGDVLYVSIPGLSRVNVTRVNGTAVLSAASDFTGSVAWLPSREQFHIVVDEVVRSLKLSVDLSSGFSIPAYGISSIINTPTVAYNRSSYGEYYDFTAFSTFTTIAPHVYVNITYFPLIAYTWTDLTIELTSNNFVLTAGDSIILRLPQFSSFVSELSVFGVNNESWKASWSNCQEQLTLSVLNKTIVFSSLALQVGKLRLPPYGVAHNVIEAMSATVSSTFYEGDLLSTITADKVGYVLYSLLEVAPGRLQEANGLNVSFVLSLPLDAGDEVSVHLPGLNFTHCSAFVQPLDTFKVLLNQSYDRFTVVAHKFVSKEQLVLVNLSTCVYFSSEGFPAYGYSTANYTLSAVTASSGVIGETPFDAFMSVGIVSAALHYEVQDISMPVSIRLEIEFSTDVVPGDEIIVYTPNFNSTQDPRSMDTLALKGDFASEGFLSHFSGSFDSMNGKIYLICNETMSARRFNLIIGRENGLTLSSNITAQHYISANITNIGRISKIPLLVEPITFPVIRGPLLSISSCDSSFRCDYSLQFTIVEDMLRGSYLTLSSPSWRLPSNKSIALIGEATDKDFNTIWRSADNIDIVQINAQNWTTASGILPLVEADYDILSVNTVISSPVELSGISIVSNDVVRVVSVRLLNLTYSSLFCDEEAYIAVKFTRPVEVFVSVDVYPQMLLITGEFARYWTGSGSNTLLFKYTVYNPEYVGGLSVAGAGALELLSSGLITFMSLNGRQIGANLSIPEPFDLYDLGDGYRKSVAVTCAVSATIAKVYDYSGKPSYGSGDILDVAIQFDRNIAVNRQPQLSLYYLDKSLYDVVNRTYDKYTLVYQNVSRTQYLVVDQAGDVSFVYEGMQTDCVNASDPTAVYNALLTLLGLSWSKPFNVTQIGTDEHEALLLFSFQGVSPYHIDLDIESCDYRASAYVQMDPTILSQAIFRLEVRANDPTGNVSYWNGTSLQNVNGSTIRLANTPFFRAVNLTLPTISESIAKIDNSSPFVRNISSTFFFDNHRAAVSGDVIPIVVEFNTEVVVYGSLQMRIAISNPLTGATYANLTLQSSSGKLLTFFYTVQLDDKSHRLIVMDLMRMANASVWRASRIPAVKADLTLPANTSEANLYGSMVSVNATLLPIILKAFCFQCPTIATAGRLLSIAVELSSNITLTTYNTSIAPFIPTVTPEGSVLRYTSGSGTSRLLFSFLVEAKETTGNISFYFNLEEGYGEDLRGQKFRNLSTVLYTVQSVLINTLQPFVVKVNCNCDDGIYYPGQTLDLYVEFDDAVLVVPSLTGSLPQLELFTPTEAGEDLLADLVGGNETNKLQFRYLIPNPNKFAMVHSPFRVDYAGIGSLQNHLNDAQIFAVSPKPETPVNLLLPTMDKSHLFFQRNIYINLTLPTVEKVFPLRAGIYTAGDVLITVVQFTTPVMFYKPAPYLLLALGSKNVTATYLTGNYTNQLQFTYTVVNGDSIAAVNYIDSRNTPYNTTATYYSLPLVAYDDYKRNIFGKVIIGIYAASQYSNFPVPVPFPIPSSSNDFAATLDTTIPQITQVTTVQPSGSYGAGTQLTINVTFSWPVVVQGCPSLQFIVQNNLRSALYLGGNGTTILQFIYTVSPTEYKVSFDYYSPQSFKLNVCGGSSEAWVRRLADQPTIAANLTLPLVNFIETIRSPKSILASGRNITVAGSSAYISLIGTAATAGTVYSFGDTISIFARFSSLQIESSEMQTWLEVSGTPNASSVYQLAYITSNLATVATSLEFGFTAGPYDDEPSLSYSGVYAVQSNSNCPFLDKSYGINSVICASQSLPVPSLVSMAGSKQQDELTPKQLKIISSLQETVVIQLMFLLPEGQTLFQAGDPITVLVEFSTPVSIVGQPALLIELVYFETNEVAVQRLEFVSQDSATVLRFAHTKGEGTQLNGGTLQCGLKCGIDMSRGVIYRSNNFLPLVPVLTNNGTNLVPPNKQCLDEQCVQFTAELLPLVPSVMAVSSNASGVQTLNDSIYIMVEFSSPLRLTGEPYLVLDLPGYPNAKYVGLFPSAVLSENLTTSAATGTGRTVLLFLYNVQSTDFSSAMTYYNQSSLKMYSGKVYAAPTRRQVEADLTLPPKGSLASLGRLSSVNIDQNRPNVLSITAVPRGSTTCGDDFVITVLYNQPMQLVLSHTYKGTGPAPDPRSQVKFTLSLQPSAANVATVTINAPLRNISGTSLIFSTFISSALPLGKIKLGNGLNPLQLGVYSLESQETNVPAPTLLSASIVNAFSVALVTSSPTVLAVTSANGSQPLSLGTGDVIVINVLFSAPVRVDGSNVTLALNLDGAVRFAEFYDVADNGTTIVFRYIISSDDRTSLLVYNGIRSLKGSVYQISRCDAAVPADLQLPAIDSPQSLSFCCPISIDSSPPYITALFPVKAPGTYSEGEHIIVVARFSGAVLVRGIPYLRLAVNDGSPTSNVSATTGVAVYTAINMIEEMFPDIPIALFDTDVPFLYTITANDSIASLSHLSPTAIVVGERFNLFGSNGSDENVAEILQQSDNPAYAADISLRAPGDLTPVDGEVSRQWAQRFFQQMTLLLHDVYHPNPRALTVRIDHGGTSGAVFGPDCCSRDPYNLPVFGQRQQGNWSPYLTGATSSGSAGYSPIGKVPLEGEDLLFSDAKAPDIAAINGIATQSSTVMNASNAIDRNFSPLAGDGSVTETIGEDNPWWQLTFPRGAQLVQSIQIYERLPEQFLQPIVQVTIKGLDRKPAGYFKLQFSQLAHGSNNQSLVLTTAYLAVGASVSDVERALSALTPLGNMLVAKYLLPLCVVPGNTLSGQGCGDGYDSGYGARYTFTFLTLLAPNPQIAVVDFKYPGESLTTISSAADALYLSELYPISIVVKSIQKGAYVPVFKEYASGAGQNTDGGSYWLTPFYVFFYNASIAASGVSADITTSKAQAIWYSEYTTIDRVLTIVLPVAYSVGAIRIQRVGFGQLSFAEITVFSSALPVLGAYGQGSPVRSTELGSLYAPNTPFKALYSQVPYDGLWVITVAQPFASNTTTTTSTTTTNSSSNSTSSTTSSSSTFYSREGFGSISEAVLLVTDLAGVVTAYYQDIYAVLETLPQHGTLYTVTSGETVEDYTSWAQALGNTILEPVRAADGRGIALGACAADSHSECLLQEELPDTGRRTRDMRERISFGYSGARPMTIITRGERVMYYLPDEDFAGQDFFTYSTYANGQLLTKDNTMTTIVQKCRRAVGQDEGYWQSIIDARGLCSCAPSGTQIIGDLASCVSARAAVCRDTGLRVHFADMCQSCYGYSNDTLLTPVPGSNSAISCRGLTIRAMALLTLRGLCIDSAAYTIQATSTAVDGQDNTTYASVKGMGKGRQAYVKGECLIPEDVLLAGRVLSKRDIVTGQALRPAY